MAAPRSSISFRPMPAPAKQGVSAVLLTQGERPDELRRAVSSVRNLASAGRSADRADDDVEIVVVWNGAVADDDSPADIDVELAENVGIPEGRNLGAEHCTYDLVVFLDDDAYFELGQTLADVTRPFMAPTTAAVAVRIADERGRTASRHVPRIGGRSALRSGEVTSFLGGAVVFQLDWYRTVGGYAGAFFYAMEESDLALRVIDAGGRVMYEPDIVVRHPWVEPSRHAGAIERTARNRVWLAHRNLPGPLAVAYVMTWLVISVVRNVTSAGALRSIVSGTLAGVRGPLGPRRPISWSTVWRLTRLGRPPVV